MPFFRMRRGEKTALAAIEHARFDSFKPLFEGAQFELDSYAIKRVIVKLGIKAAKLGKNIEELAKGGSSGSQSGAAASAAADPSLAREFVTACLGGEAYTDIAELAAEVTPIIGAIYTSAKAVKEWRSVMKSITMAEMAQEAQVNLAPGNPEAAHQAVMSLLDREFKRHSAQAVRNTAAASTKIAGLFADLGTATGPVLGIVNAVAGMVIDLVDFALYLREMRIGNELLKNLDDALANKEVFEECPLLGCYFLTCADTSIIVDFFLTDIVDRNLEKGAFMTRIEKIKSSKIDPLLKAASKVIEHAPIKIKGMSADKGMKHKGGISEMLKNNAANNQNRFGQAQGHTN